MFWFIAKSPYTSKQVEIVNTSKTQQRKGNE
jgi:hypothetical protein